METCGLGSLNHGKDTTMKPQKRLLLASMAGILVLTLVPATYVRAGAVSGGVVVAPHAGIGVWIGGSTYTPPRPPAPHREVVITRPWHRRFVRIGPPRPTPVVVHRPVIAPPVIVESGPIEVWITNSNGSRTSVTLTRQGGYYIGPRGEYYTGMPTNEQLRVAYGF
jgi:hypothetical protein